MKMKFYIPLKSPSIIKALEQIRYTICSDFHVNRLTRLDVSSAPTVL
jgi:hypothetical protein